MAGYAASNLLAGTQQAISTSYKTLVNLSAATAALRRQRIVEFIFSVDGTPADNVATCDVSRSTAIGTGTTATPNPLDAADGVMGGVATVNHTVEPTIAVGTARVEGWGFNQRATQRWVAFPGKELIVPAVNLNGLAFRLKSPGYTGTAVCDVITDE